MAPVDRLLRADRPSQTRLPSAYRHRKILAAPSSPLRIKISRIRFAQVGRTSYFSRCPISKMPRGATITDTRTTRPKTASASEQTENSSKLVSSSQESQLLMKRCDAGLEDRIVWSCGQQHAYAAHPRGLLRPRRKRPRCRAAEQRDEFAPPDHSITSLARARSVAGTVMPSALAV